MSDKLVYLLYLLDTCVDLSDNFVYLFDTSVNLSDIMIWEKNYDNLESISRLVRSVHLSNILMTNRLTVTNENTFNNNILGFLVISISFWYVDIKIWHSIIMIKIWQVDLNIRQVRHNYLTSCGRPMPPYSHALQLGIFWQQLLIVWLHDLSLKPWNPLSMQMIIARFVHILLNWICIQGAYSVYRYH